MKVNRVEELLNDICSENKVVKQIDFLNDIDVASSDKYCIDNASNGLRFLYAETRKFKHEDYSCITGSSVITNAGVELVPTLNAMTDNRVKRSHISENKGFRLEQEDFIYLKAIAEWDTNFFISIDNMYTRQLFERLQKKEIFLAGLEYDNPMRKTYTYQIGSSFVIRRYEQLNETDRKDIPIRREKNVELGINLAKGYLIIDGQKRLMPKVDFDTKEKLFASVIFNLGINEKEKRKMLVSAMGLGKETGFIYFKPYRIEEKFIQVFMIYSGTPKVQYLNSSKKQWIDITEESRIRVADLSLIRLAMNNWDCIHNLLITEEGDLR